MVVGALNVGTNPVAMAVLPCYAVPCDRPREQEKANQSD